MTAKGARTSLATLAVVAGVTALAAATFFIVSHAERHILPAVLACVVAVPAVLCVRVLLDALERWTHGADSEAGGEDDR